MSENDTDDDDDTTQLEEYSQRILYAGNLDEDHLSLLNTVTQQTRYTILLDILAHPKQAPSLRELSYFMPDTGRTTIVNHLETLIEWGVVEKRVIPEGDRCRSLPYVFYTISPYGREFIDLHELVPQSLEEMREDYLQIRTSDEITRYQDAPRDGAIVITDDREAEKFRTLYRAVEDDESGGFSLRCWLGYHSWTVSAFHGTDESSRAIEERCDRCGEERIL